MAEKRKGARSGKKKDQKGGDDEMKPSKQDYEVLNYLRKTLPEKRTMLLGHKVDYFISEKAIDCLLDSKWAVKQKDETEALFTTRESVVDFMERLLRLKMFHRAKVVVVTKKKKEDEGSAIDEPKKSKKSKDANDEGKETEKKEKKKKEVKDGDEKKDGEEKKGKKSKKKIKLDMHLEQIFVDGKESYVWIYDPIPLKTWFIGLGMVVGAILICLFPLWPRIVRTYVYYLSVAAAGCLFFIIALALLRYVFFVIVWAATFGKHHFWMLPNLTEDVGFFASFWPLYTHEYMGGEEKSVKKVKKQSKTTEENSKQPNSDSVAQEVPGPSREKSVETESKPVNENSDDDEVSSEASGSTSTNKSFEILDSKDLIDSGPQNVSNP